MGYLPLVKINSSECLRNKELVKFASSYCYLNSIFVREHDA